MTAEYRQKALDQMRNEGLCHMATIDGDKPAIRVMHGGQVDDDFTVWFATGLSSHKVAQLRQNPHTSLSFFNGKSDICLHGKGEVLTDQATRDAHWHETLERYFPGGSTDPEYALIRITPETILFREFETTGFNTVKLLG